MPHGKSGPSNRLWILIILALTAVQIIISYFFANLAALFSLPQLEPHCCRTSLSLMNLLIEVVWFVGNWVFLLPTVPILTVFLVVRWNKKRWNSVPLWLIWALTASLSIVSQSGSLDRLSYNKSAQSAGRNAKLAEEVYYNDCEGRGGGDCQGHYTDKLASLLRYGRDLTDDPLVTFSFGNISTSGYTFTTTHKCSCGRTVYTWTD